jgi:type IV secretion system protein TrbL
MLACTHPAFDGPVILFISVWQPLVAFAAGAIAILMLIVLALITVNLILVNCETWILLSAGLIFLCFGATEWTRDLTVSYFKHPAWCRNKTVRDAFARFHRAEHHEFFVCGGITDGLGFRSRGLATALVDTFILLIVIAKVPAAVASICGISAGWTGGYGMSTLFAGSRYGSASGSYGFGRWGRSVVRGRVLGSAVRNGVKQGQALSRGKP